MIVPFAPFFKNGNWWEDLQGWRFIYSADGNKWFIVGDNPIITRGDNDHDPVNCLKEFIFPVSGRILLISGHSHIRQELPPEFVVEYSAGVIQRARRFVACQSKAFLEAVIQDHQVYVDYGKTDIIIPQLFEVLGQGKDQST